MQRAVASAVVLVARQGLVSLITSPVLTDGGEGEQVGAADEEGAWENNKQRGSGL